MKYAVEMGSGDLIFIPSFIKIGSGILKLIGVIHGHIPVGGIYEVRRGYELRCHDIRTRFHKDWFAILKLTRANSQTQRLHGDCISQL
jgi:hypothetical protein